MGLQLTNQEAEVRSRQGHWRLFPYRLCLVFVDVEDDQSCTHCSNKLWEGGPFLRRNNNANASVLQ